MLKSRFIKGVKDYEIGDLPAKKFMTRRVFKARKGDSIKSVLKLMINNKISGVPVVNDRNDVLGIISEYDLLLQAAVLDHKKPIKYNTDVESVDPETTLKNILVLLYKKKIKRVPVVDKNKGIIGIISRIDVLSAIDKSRKD